MKRHLLILLTLFAFSSCIKEGKEGANLKVGDRLPSFSVQMNDGSIVSDANLVGETSVVMFFHTSCPDCQKALPRMQKVYDEYLGRGVRFVLISRAEGATSIADFWSQNSLTMPYSPQEDRDVYELFAQERIPRIYINDKNGIIRAIFTDNPVPEYSDIKSALDSSF